MLIAQLLVLAVHIDSVMTVFGDHLPTPTTTYTWVYYIS